MLLEAAAKYAFDNGARIVEGYPADKEWAEDGAGGTIDVFARAGFTETRRITDHVALMRRHHPVF
jgi:hypothetical protein